MLYGIYLILLTCSLAGKDRKMTDGQHGDGEMRMTGNLCTRDVTFQSQAILYTKSKWGKNNSIN